MKIAFIGAGRMAHALTKIASFNHTPLFAIDIIPQNAQNYTQNTSVPSSTNIKDFTHLLPCIEILFITTNDDQIDKIPPLINNLLAEHTALVHTSGALASDILKTNNPKASIHPMIACPNTNSTVQNTIQHYTNATFSIEGTPQTTQKLKSLINPLNPLILDITPEHKPKIHLAASILSNYTVTLTHIATNLLLQANIPENIAQSTLLNLLDSTIKNLKEKSLYDALTGPIKRNDLKTIKKHMDTIKDDEITHQLYISLKKATEQLINQHNHEYTHRT